MPAGGVRGDGEALDDASCRPPGVGVMPVDDGPHGFAQVAQEMPAVGDLHGLGRTLPDAVGVGARAVAGDDLDRRMLPQPSGQGLGLAVGQQIDDLVALGGVSA